MHLGILSVGIENGVDLQGHLPVILTQETALTITLLVYTDLGSCILLQVPIPVPMVLLLSIGPLGTNFSEILIQILTFSFKKMYLKMSAKWQLLYLSLNLLMVLIMLDKPPLFFDGEGFQIPVGL